MYKVVKYFTDLQDNNYAYSVGDTYPRVGLQPTEKRYAELSGSSNKQGTPLIEVVTEEEIITDDISEIVINTDEITEDEPEEEKPKKLKRRKGND